MYQSQLPGPQKCGSLNVVQALLGGDSVCLLCFPVTDHESDLTCGGGSLIVHGGEESRKKKKKKKVGLVVLEDHPMLCPFLFIYLVCF